MAILNDTQINGNLNVTEDIQMSGKSLSELFSNDTNGWVSLSNRCYYKVKNGICTITGNSLGHVSLTADTYNTVCTIPASIAPDAIVHFTPNSVGGSDPTMTGHVSGTDVRIYKKTASAYWAFSVTYPI